MPALDYQIVKTAPTEAIVELYQAGGWWKESEEWRAIIPRMIAGSFAFMVAREPDGRLVGMGRAISDGVSDAYIQDVVVLRSHRGKGIGAELVRRLAEHCAGHGISWIGLVAEPGTQPFYEHLGFHAFPGQPMLFGQG
ncbi:MAG TPA: GNAT family N-acetyltransferase [Myxococcales bacterium]|jgi:GNAT superfamily N-acetyltransferase